MMKLAYLIPMTYSGCTSVVSLVSILLRLCRSCAGVTDESGCTNLVCNWSMYSSVSTFAKPKHAGAIVGVNKVKWLKVIFVI